MKGRKSQGRRKQVGFRPPALHACLLFAALSGAPWEVAVSSVCLGVTFASAPHLQPSCLLQIKEQVQAEEETLSKEPHFAAQPCPARSLLVTPVFLVAIRSQLYW